MPLYEASIQSLAGTQAKRVYTSSRREAVKALRNLVLEFGPALAPYQARVMATDSGGWLVREVVTV